MRSGLGIKITAGITYQGLLAVFYVRCSYCLNYQRVPFKSIAAKVNEVKFIGFN